MQLEGAARHITQWMLNYATEAGVNGFVVGISGGVDSALTSSLAARTGLPVLCVEMPIHQPTAQISRAREHILSLQEHFPLVERVDVQLTGVFEQLLSALPAVEDSDRRQMSLVNTRARLRMTTLYYFAALRGFLVAGTGNKVEDFGVGFFTKYGDGGVDLSPIADLVKTEVFALAAHLGVPESILSAPPTDGLWGDDRTDEDQLGATYPELEWAMAQAERGKAAEDFTGRQAEVMAIYTRLNRINRHKMEPIPVCRIPDTLR